MARSALILVSLLVFAISAPFSVHAAAVELIVSVPASLTDAVTEIQPHFEAAFPDVKLRLNFGSSGALQQQIEHGAPVDVFISAADAPVNQLIERGLIAESSVRPVAANRLVLISPAHRSAVAIDDWADLQSERVRRVAVGDPQHVPAGIYARETLESLALWDPLQPRFVLGEDVRQVLQYVRLGAVDAGIVYSTDAASAPLVKVVAAAPVGSHHPIIYPAAPIQTSRHPEEAHAFVEFLLSEAARQVFSKHGFSPVE